MFQMFVDTVFSQKHFCPELTDMVYTVLSMLPIVTELIATCIDGQGVWLSLVVEDIHVCFR